MMKDAFKPDPLRRADLSDQLAGWLRDRIAGGRLKVGEKLPTMRALAESSGVSFKTARQAVERLAREGYVNSRPHIGTVVLPRNVTVWRGRVLLINLDCAETGYYVNAIMGEVRRHLMAAGFLTSRISVSREERDGCAQLDAMLGQCFDFAFLVDGSPMIERMLTDAGIPFVALGGTNVSDKSVRRLSIVSDGEDRRFVEHCRHAGIRSIAEVDYGVPDADSLAARLKAAGFDMRHIAVEPLKSCGLLEGIERAAYTYFRRLDKKDFPDLLLVWDDYVVRGLLTAFLARGIDVPRDVRLVALTNVGFEPVFPKSLTRFEYDPARYGAQTAGFIASVLSKGRIPSMPVLERAYVIGETFPY